MLGKHVTESVVREIRRNTRKKCSAEEKIRIVLEGLRGEESTATICRREGINTNLYYKWSKDFLEAGKKRLPLFVQFVLTTYNLVASSIYLYQLKAGAFSQIKKMSLIIIIYVISKQQETGGGSL